MRDWWRCRQPVLGRSLVILRWVGGWPPDGRATLSWPWLLLAAHIAVITGPQVALVVGQLLLAALESRSAGELSGTLGHVSSEVYILLMAAMTLHHRRDLLRIARNLDSFLDESLAGGGIEDEDGGVQADDDGAEGNSGTEDNGGGLETAADDPRAEAQAMLRVYGRVHKIWFVLCAVEGPVVMFLPLVIFMATANPEYLFVMRVWGPVSGLPPTSNASVLAHYAAHAFILCTFIANFGALYSLKFNLLLGLRGSFRCVAAHFRALARLETRQGFSEERAARLHRRFLRVTVLHQRVLAVSKEVDAIFRSLFLIKVGCTLLMLIFACFQISKGLSNIPYFVIQLTLEGFNFFMLCLAGHEILTESEGVLRALFDVPFIGTPPAFRKDLLLVMTALSQPHRMRIGKFAFLTMETFKWAMKTAWSGYAVLDASTSKAGSSRT